MRDKSREDPATTVTDIVTTTVRRNAMGTKTVATGLAVALFISFVQPAPAAFAATWQEENQESARLYNQGEYTVNTIIFALIVKAAVF